MENFEEKTKLFAEQFDIYTIQQELDDWKEVIESLNKKIGDYKIEKEIALKNYYFYLSAKRKKENMVLIK